MIAAACGRDLEAPEDHHTLLRAMSISSHPSLTKIRTAILQRRLVRFTYGKKIFAAEPHLLGTLRSTKALTLQCWVLGSDPRWLHFRYAAIRDLEVLPHRFVRTRHGYNPHSHRVASIDTSLEPDG